MKLTTFLLWLVLLVFAGTAYLSNYEQIQELQIDYKEAKATQNQLIERAQLLSAVEQMGFTLQATQLEKVELAFDLRTTLEENQMLHEQLQRAAEMIRVLMQENEEFQKST